MRLDMYPDDYYEDGNLHLSKAAQAYHPGQGVYRSSFKNALRLTRTEVNMAYRVSDFERWAALDFVVGYEIRLSNNPHHCPMCEELAGRYPKDFKWRGWHPQCRCYMIPILATEKEFNKQEKAFLNDEDTGDFRSVNHVDGFPQGFKDFVKENSKKIALAKSKPFFFVDNPKVFSNISSASKIADAVDKLFNTDSTTLFSSFVPFSATIIAKMQQLASEKERQALLKEITNFDGFEEVEKRGAAVIMKHPLHNTNSGGWKNELSIAKRIVNNGQSVWFLPESDNISNADAITTISNKYKLVDFKNITSTNPSQIANGIMQAFKQGGNAVIRLENADLGQFRDAIDEIKRKWSKRQIGLIKVVTNKGKVFDLSENDINSSRYLKKIRGNL